jgi:hypothetical protein
LTALESTPVAEVQDDEPTLAEEPVPDEPELPRTPEELGVIFEGEAGRGDMVELEAVIDRSVAAVEMPGVEAKEIDCRASLCRVTFAFDANTSEREFMSRFTSPRMNTQDTKRMDALAGTVGSREEYEDGSRTMVLYLEQGLPGAQL